MLLIMLVNLLKLQRQSVRLVFRWSFNKKTQMKSANFVLARSSLLGSQFSEYISICSITAI